MSLPVAIKTDPTKNADVARTSADRGPWSVAAEKGDGVNVVNLLSRNEDVESRKVNGTRG